MSSCRVPYDVLSAAYAQAAQQQSWENHLSAKPKLPGLFERWAGRFMSGPVCTGSAMACKPLLVQLANRNRVSVCRYKAGEPLGALARSVELPPCLLVRRFLEFIPEAHGLVSAVLQHSSLLQHDFSCLDKVLYEFGLMCLLCLAAVLYQTQALVHLTWPHGLMLHVWLAEGDTRAAQPKAA